MLISAVETNTDKTILAIDTSFDETSVAVTRGTQVLANELYSQIDMHQAYGGVVPAIAKLAHAQKIDEVINQALKAANLGMSEIDAIAVTVGPGLAITLEVGINKAKELAKLYKLPLISVNHMEGHLISVFADSNGEQINYPALALLVSGAHSEIVLVSGEGKYQILGETLDDAVGEAYDKCARMMGLNYPGGPEISKLAAGVNFELKMLNRNSKAYAQLLDHGEVEMELPLPMIYSKDLDMSFSGLKTAFKALVLKTAGVDSLDKVNLEEEQKQKLSYLLEKVINTVLLAKLEQAAQDQKAKEIWLGGGVAANEDLQRRIKLLEPKYKVRMPSSRKLMVDNAAMIGIVGGKKLRQGNYYTEEQFEQIDRDPIWNITNA